MSLRTPRLFQMDSGCQGQGRDPYPRGSQVHSYLDKGRHFLLASAQGRISPFSADDQIHLENNLYDEFYVKNYTNAAFIVWTEVCVR